MSYPYLLADIGGTKARFAIETAPGKFGAIHVLACANYGDISAAIKAYLDLPTAIEAGSKNIKKAGIAIANPVDDDIVKMTNHHWTFSIEEVKREFNFSVFVVVNDFNALAMALPFLNHTQKYQVGQGETDPDGVIGVLGAGTGLGVSGLVPTEHSWIALDSEGGHASFSPINEREVHILQFGLKIYDHVSMERLLSGSGLKLIYLALAEQSHVAPDNIEAPDILERGLSGHCSICREVLTTFCEILGTAAGNLALTLGTKGGIYIGGGIVPRLGEFFYLSPFRQRFERKGRFTTYLQQIPTFVIVEAFPTFIGMSVILRKYAGA